VTGAFPPPAPDDEQPAPTPAGRILTPDQVAQKYGYDDAAEMRRCETAGREIDAEVDAAERAAGMGGRHHEKTAERLRELDRAEWAARLLETRTLRGSGRAVDIPPDLRAAMRPYLPGTFLDHVDDGAAALVAYGFANPDDPLGLGRVPGLFVDEPVQFGKYKRVPGAPAGAADLAQHFGYPDVGPVLAMIEEDSDTGEAIKRIAAHRPDRGALPPGWTQKQWETAAKSLYEARTPGGVWEELPLASRERWFRQVSEAFEAGRSAASAAMVPQRLITLPPGHELEVGMNEVGPKEFAERAAGEGGAPGVPQSVVHASRELIRAGVFASDPDFAGALLAAVCGFHSYRHSGGSAESGIETLMRLLRRESLLPVTADPAEWAHPEAGPPDVDTWWQNRHDSRALSRDGGKTWWFAEGRHPGERCYSPAGGDELGVLEECRGCGGRGVVHVPESAGSAVPLDEGSAPAADQEVWPMTGKLVIDELGIFHQMVQRVVSRNEGKAKSWSYQCQCGEQFERTLEQGGSSAASDAVDAHLAQREPRAIRVRWRTAQSQWPLATDPSRHGLESVEKNRTDPARPWASAAYACLCGEEFFRSAEDGGPEAAEAALNEHVGEKTSEAKA
jgi:hypothetical protein